MNKAIKSMIYQMLEGIEHTEVLNQVMEDAAFYTSQKYITGNLNKAQQTELNKAIEEADANDTISFDDFKRDMNNREKNNYSQPFSQQYLHVYNYLMNEFSAATAYKFPLRVEKRIDFIAANPTIRKRSAKRKNTRSIFVCSA